ncbi:DUF4142 domain-containing protein [Alcaligenaceae bacterium]|nr:DUF4142 domain-containing protein [Alcaligenaceae bacterium]
MAFAFSTTLGGLSVQAQTTQGAQPAAGTQATQPGTSTQAAQPAANPQGQSQLTQEDANFLENAIQGSHAEVEGSQLALEKTSSQDIKDFAQMMIKDHQMMAKEASSLAQEKGMTPPDGPSAMQVTEITALKALSGGAFDAMYVNRIGVASHEATVNMFEKASKGAQDADVKALATKALPKLKEHLEMARSLNEKQEK